MRDTPALVTPRGAWLEFWDGLLVIEMHRANESLSGMGWKNSFPSER